MAWVYDTVYNTPMTKQPPVTLRVPAEMRAEIEAFAGKKRLTKNAAYVEVLRRGLQAAMVDGRPVVAAKNAASLEQSTRALVPVDVERLRDAVLEADARLGPGVGLPFGPKVRKPGELAKKGKTK